MNKHNKATVTRIGRWVTTQAKKANKISDPLGKVVVALTIGAAGIYYTNSQEHVSAELRQAEINQSYNEIAVDILAEPINPDEPATEALREWAVKILNQNSPVELSDTLQHQLITGAETLPTNDSLRSSSIVAEVLNSVALRAAGIARYCFDEDNSQWTETQSGESQEDEPLCDPNNN